MNTRHYLTAIIVLLAMHLLFVNTEIISKLLKALNGLQRLPLVQSLGAALFALSYSLITVLILKVYPRLWLFLLTASFDGFAVYLNYTYKPWFSLAAAVYLGFYTTLIIVATGLIERERVKNEEITGSYEILTANLKRQRQSIRNALNRTKDQTKRERLQIELQRIDDQLASLTQKPTRQ